MYVCLSTGRRVCPDHSCVYQTRVYVQVFLPDSVRVNEWTTGMYVCRQAHVSALTIHVYQTRVSVRVIGSDLTNPNHVCIIHVCL